MSNSNMIERLRREKADYESSKAKEAEERAKEAEERAKEESVQVANGDADGREWARNEASFERLQCLRESVRDPIKLECEITLYYPRLSANEIARGIERTKSKGYWRAYILGAVDEFEKVASEV